MEGEGAKCRTPLMNAVIEDAIEDFIGGEGEAEER